MGILTSRPIRYALNLSLIFVLTILFVNADPFYAATGASRAFQVLPMEWQAGIGLVLLALFLLFGGRPIVLIVLLFATIFFLPSISFQEWDDVLWQAASWWTGSSRGPVVSQMYGYIHRGASLVVYAIVLFIAVRIGFALRRKYKKH